MSSTNEIGPVDDQARLSGSCEARYVRDTSPKLQASRDMKIDVHRPPGVSAVKLSVLSRRAACFSWAVGLRQSRHGLGCKHLEAQGVPSRGGRGVSRPGPDVCLGPTGCPGILGLQVNSAQSVFAEVLGGLSLVKQGPIGIY